MQMLLIMNQLDLTEQITFKNIYEFEVANANVNVIWHYIKYQTVKMEFILSNINVLNNVGHSTEF